MCSRIIWAGQGDEDEDEDVLVTRRGSGLGSTWILWSGLGCDEEPLLVLLAPKNQVERTGIEEDEGERRRPAASKDQQGHTRAVPKLSTRQQFLRSCERVWQETSRRRCPRARSAPCNKLVLAVGAA